jgi:hypothetical protein
MKHILRFTVIIFILLFSSGNVSASDISNAQFTGNIQVTNNSTLSNAVCIPVNITTSNLINAGILSATASNIAAITDTGADTAIMPGYGTNPWMIFVPSITNNSNQSVTFYTGASGGKIAYFPTTTGMIVSDSATMEPGNNFIINIHAYFDLTRHNYIFFKGSAFYIYNTSDNVVQVYSYAAGTPNFSVSGLTSGEHYLSVYTNSGNMTLSWDGVVKGTVSLAGTSIPNTSQEIQIGSLSTSYMISSNFTQSGVLRGSWVWQYGSTFTDLSGNSNTATPSFKTTSSSASVNATLTTFNPLIEAKSTLNPSTSWPSLMTAPLTQSSTMYTENTTPGIFFANVIHAIWPSSSVPESLFWYGFTFFTIILSGMLIYAAFASKGQSALLIKVILMSAIMLFWSLPGPNVYGMYVVFFFMMWCFGVIILSKNYGW